MDKMEKIVSTVYITGGLVLLMVVIMAMSSCSSTKNCCEKAMNEVYKYEGEYINEENK